MAEEPRVRSTGGILSHHRSIRKQWTWTRCNGPRRNGPRSDGPRSNGTRSNRQGQAQQQPSNQPGNQPEAADPSNRSQAKGPATSPSSRTQQQTQHRILCMYYYYSRATTYNALHTTIDCLQSSCSWPISALESTVQSSIPYMLCQTEPPMGYWTVDGCRN